MLNLRASEGSGFRFSDEVQQTSEILGSTDTYKTKADSYKELTENAELDELVTNMFATVPNTDMVNYWKDFLWMCDALFLSIHANHDLINSQHAMLP